MSLAVVEHESSLEEAILRLINLGEKDPLTIARKLADRYGGEWIAARLAERWEQILAEIARQRLGSERRAAIHSLGGVWRHGGRVTKREVVLTSTFVPGKGCMRTGDLTADDLTAREAYLRRLAGGLHRWADWHAELRGLLEAQGVEMVGQIKGPLPELPSAPTAELTA